jgi:hypothetical protein
MDSSVRVVPLNVERSWSLSGSWSSRPGDSPESPTNLRDLFGLFEGEPSSARRLSLDRESLLRLLGLAVLPSLGAY